MSFTTTRALSTEISFAVHGVPASFVLPSGDTIATDVVWSSLHDEEQAVGVERGRVSPARVVMVRRGIGLDAVPRGTTVSASRSTGGAALGWSVEGFDAGSDDDMIRIRVVRA